MQTTFLQPGRLHLPIFGVLAALGVMLALAMSQRTARYAGIDPDAAWNAGMTAVVSAFAISRGLLIAFNWHSFLEYPLLLLALPSLTPLGVLLTGLFLSIYLRMRGIALLPLLDAMAPCAALLWAFLSFGRALAGDREGMPTAPGGPAARIFGAVYPVEIDTAIAAALLCAGLLLVLFARPPRGSTASVALILAGFAVFFVDFFRLPSELVAGSWLDPAQAVALAMLGAGGLLLHRSVLPVRTNIGNETHRAI